MTFGAFVTAEALVSPYVPGAYSYYDTDHVVLSGTTITGVLDQSGNARHIVSGVGTKTLTPGWRNGRAAWLQSGTSVFDEPTYPNLPVGLAQPNTTVIVGQWPSSAAVSRTPMQGTNTNLTAPFFQTSAGLIRCYADGGTDQTFLTTPAGLLSQPFVALITMNGTSSKARIWYHGGTKTNNTVTGSPGTDGLGTTAWGSAPNTSFAWQNYLAMKGTWARAFTSDEETAILQGLCDYYGIVPL